MLFPQQQFGVARPLGAIDAAQFINSLPGAPQVLTYLKAEVKTAARNAVLPYMLGAMGISAVALVLSIIAIAKK